MLMWPVADSSRAQVDTTRGISMHTQPKGKMVETRHAGQDTQKVINLSLGAIGK